MRQAFAPLQLKITLSEAVAAALAAGVAICLGLPIWSMFLGWNAYFTRGTGLKSGLVNFGCVVIGLSVGMLAQYVFSSLSEHPGLAEQMASVFAVTWVVLSLRFLPKFNNVPGFFLGLIAFFASRLAPGWPALTELGGAALLGTAAGFATSAAQARWLGGAATPIAASEPTRPREQAAA